MVPATARWMTVNDNWPPPAIEVPKGVVLEISVDNRSGEPVTLHFHGLLQKNGLTLMDGPEGISQR
jgi:FtsP/CotA-like multicopper oxidase with cupredoxin domain